MWALGIYHWNPEGFSMFDRISIKVYTMIVLVVDVEGLQIMKIHSLSIRIIYV